MVQTSRRQRSPDQPVVALCRRSSVMYSATNGADAGRSSSIPAFCGTGARYFQQLAHRLANLVWRLDRRTPADRWHPTSTTVTARTWSKPAGVSTLAKPKSPVSAPTISAGGLRSPSAGRCDGVLSGKAAQRIEGLVVEPDTHHVPEASRLPTIADSPPPHAAIRVLVGKPDKTAGVDGN